MMEAVGSIIAEVTRTLNVRTTKFLCCMTTRSRRRYQKLDLEIEVMSVDLSQVLQALIEDRQAHERDLAEEHERREEEQ